MKKISTLLLLLIFASQIFAQENHIHNLPAENPLYRLVINKITEPVFVSAFKQEVFEKAAIPERDWSTYWLYLQQFIDDDKLALRKKIEKEELKSVVDAMQEVEKRKQFYIEQRSDFYLVRDEIIRVKKSLDEAQEKEAQKFSE